MERGTVDMKKRSPNGWDSLPGPQSAEYNKIVANISLFIYIGGWAYIKIVATCQDLVATVTISYIYILVCVCVIIFIYMCV